MLPPPWPPEGRLVVPTVATGSAGSRRCQPPAPPAAVFIVRGRNWPVARSAARPLPGRAAPRSCHRRRPSTPVIGRRVGRPGVPIRRTATVDILGACRKCLRPFDPFAGGPRPRLRKSVDRKPAAPVSQTAGLAAGRARGRLTETVALPSAQPFPADRSMASTPARRAIPGECGQRRTERCRRGTAGTRMTWKRVAAPSVVGRSRTPGWCRRRGRPPPAGRPAR